MKKEGDNRLIPTKLSFEDLKKVSQYGIEYWSARDLQSSLGYSKWQRFENAIRKAIESCKQSGNDPMHHFTDASKPILGTEGSSQIVEDYHLSRFACYLIAQNGDPRKSEIAHAQKYFAIQTRRQELSDAVVLAAYDGYAVFLCRTLRSKMKHILVTLERAKKFQSQRFRFLMWEAGHIRRRYDRCSRSKR
jgi:hypothetical protein